MPTKFNGLQVFIIFLFKFQVDNLVKHIALGHSKLDEFLMDEELVSRKRDQILSKQKRVSVTKCPICFVENPSREHLVRHFMEELLEIVENEISDELSCDKCEFRYGRHHKREDLNNRHILITDS